MNDETPIEAVAVVFDENSCLEIPKNPQKFRTLGIH